MYPSEKFKIEMTNVEDMKDVANEFDILSYHEILEKRKEKERLYEQNQGLIKQDLENLKNEIMDRENLKKLREIFEFIEKHDPNYYLQLNKAIYRDLIVGIFDNFLEDLSNPNNNLVDYNLIREALKFVNYMEESQSFSRFFEIYNTQKNLKGKLKEHEDVLLGKLDKIVKGKQKKRKQELTKKKKQLTEEIGREISKNKIPLMNNLLENDFSNKKEEDSIKKMNIFDMIPNQEFQSHEQNGCIKQEIKIEPGNKNKIKRENNDIRGNPPNKDAEMCNNIVDDIEHMISESEGEKEENKSLQLQMRNEEIGEK